MSHVILYYYILEWRMSIFIPVYNKARIDSIGSIFKLSFTKKLQYWCILQPICTPTCTFFRCPDFVVFMVYLLDSSVTNMEASSKCMHMECQSGPNTCTVVDPERVVATCTHACTAVCAFYLTLFYLFIFSPR